MSMCTFHKALALVLGELLLVVTAGQSNPSAPPTSVEVQSGCPAQGECASSLLQLGQLRERQVVQAADSAADSGIFGGWFGDDDESKKSDDKADSKKKDGKAAVQFDEDAGMKAEKGDGGGDEEKKGGDVDGDEEKKGEKKAGDGDGDGDKKGENSDGDKKDGDSDADKKDADGDGDGDGKDKAKAGGGDGNDDDKKKDDKKKAKDGDGEKKGNGDGDEENKTSTDKKKAKTAPENKTSTDNSTNETSSNASAAKKNDTKGDADNKGCVGWKTYVPSVRKTCPKSDLVANVTQCEAVLKLLKYDYKFAGSTTSSERPAGCFYVESTESGQFNKKSGTVPDDSEDGVHAICTRCLTEDSDDEAADTVQSVPDEDRSSDGDKETTPF